MFGGYKGVSATLDLRSLTPSLDTTMGRYALCIGIGYGNLIDIALTDVEAFQGLLTSEYSLQVHPTVTLLTLGETSS